MKLTIISITISALLIGGTIFMSEKASSEEDSVNNTSIIDGKQVIEITAKGRYLPKITSAKSDIPTILKIKTNGTFDCTSALTIPSIGYQQNLPPTGETEVEIPPQKAGTTMQGICSMGMYSFSVNFE
jgi:plastocyanin domain-containing protein